MVRKAADDTRKTTVNRRKTTLNRRISGSCYKSFRQNGDVFRRNSRPGKDLELWSYGVEFKTSPDNELRPKTTVAHSTECIQHLTRMELTSPKKIFDEPEKSDKV